MPIPCSVFSRTSFPPITSLPAPEHPTLPPSVTPSLFGVDRSLPPRWRPPTESLQHRSRPTWKSPPSLRPMAMPRRLTMTVGHRTPRHGRALARRSRPAQLKQRHLSMIALGGTIGTGLFVGLGLPRQRWSRQHPHRLHDHGCRRLLYDGRTWRSQHAPRRPRWLHPPRTRFLDPSLGFALGWTYWYSYGITIPTEISASAIVIQYWDTAQSINPAAWISILLVLVIGVNALGVKYYGEPSSGSASSRWSPSSSSSSPRSSSTSAAALAATASDSATGRTRPHGPALWQPDPVTGRPPAASAAHSVASSPSGTSLSSPPSRLQVPRSSVVAVGEA